MATTCVDDLLCVLSGLRHGTPLGELRESVVKIEEKCQYGMTSSERDNLIAEKKEIEKEVFGIYFFYFPPRFHVTETWKKVYTPDKEEFDTMRKNLISDYVYKNLPSLKYFKGRFFG